MQRRDPAFKPLPRRRAYEEIILQVEHALADGRLAEGDRLPSERELAETFGVSRTSVREALRVLEVFGVVVARRGGGADAGSIVTADTRSGLVSMLRLHSALQRIPTSDFVDLRSVIEAEAARRAAELPEPPTAALHTLIDEMRTAPTKERYHQLDTSFHVELARISGNAVIPLLMEALRDVMERAMLRALDGLPSWTAERDRLVEEHNGIVERIEAGDAAGASALVASHVGRFYRDAVAGDD